jgi:hypothetical protein
VEAVDGAAFGHGLAGGGEIAEALQHSGGGPGDDGGVKTANAGGELGAEGAGDLIVRSAGVIVIDAGKAVDLEINEAWGKVKRAGFGGWLYGTDGILKGEFDGKTGQCVDAGTLQ